jgi:hypothetical protein
MSFKTLLGLEEMNLTDMEILKRIKEAYDHDLDEVEFVQEDNSKVIIKLPHINRISFASPFDQKDRFAEA